MIAHLWGDTHTHTHTCTHAHRQYNGMKAQIQMNILGFGQHMWPTHMFHLKLANTQLDLSSFAELFYWSFTD